VGKNIAGEIIIFHGHCSRRERVVEEDRDVQLKTEVGCRKLITVKTSLSWHLLQLGYYLEVRLKVSCGPATAMGANVVAQNQSTGE